MQTPSFQLEEDNLKSKAGLTRLSMDHSGDKSQSGSINDNNNNEMDERTKSMLGFDKNDDGNEIDKVTPYSIKNLTKFKFEVMGGGLQLVADPDSFLDPLGSPFNLEDNSMRVSECQRNGKVYKLKPGQEIEYAVEYEQLARFILEG